MNEADKTGGPPSGDADTVPGSDVTPAVPRYVGRYRIERVLGKGGFGLVYLAHDEQLQRLVAIKVPHANLVAHHGDVEAYLKEARNVARLDHPNIVPVHDVGSTEAFPCFIVSKFIDGSDLAKRLRRSRLSLNEAVSLVATVAEALHHAHKQGLVHRDVKPSNILLDRSGNPFVGDFGLALREEDVGTGSRHAGTPAYMSPEQARGEGHRVDGRSDIFSLGVVFYELLVGQPPFRADSHAELMEQVANHEPRPLRQRDESIPKELERICFKALSKRASERYMTAKDMADDLKCFMADQTITQQSSPDARGTPARAAEASTLSPSTGNPDGRRNEPSAAVSTLPGPAIKIVPKGLRSFDAHDADFFLELLPGPRDRGGSPDSIRFWKTRIEETDAEKTFSVGLICGPSGCGKSSLVKAGLLPRLSSNVIVVYVEATSDDTEARLLHGLRKRCPGLPADLGVRQSLAALRRGQGVPVGAKVLIVLDQFEQWLHANKEENTELVRALRHCEGSRVQCIVMVRDDFWMAVIRFMRELEVRLIEGENSAAVDLFDTDHARRVLGAFGRAFGKLPENAGEIDAEQKEFVKQAVRGLANEGKVVPVRLALFAEMMKGKSWTPASLKAVGGTEGVGVTFLEEAFSTSSAPPDHRYHQKAARAVLRVLLPESGSDIKGHMRSYDELLEASGYGGRPREFDDLVRILDNGIRLITPTDPEGKDAESESVSRTKPGQKYYQLTHDYLVHSIRNWLTRKQKETRQGRAELMLEDRAAVWNARPENRQLPSLFQWLQIRWFTPSKNWTAPERRMVRKAGRRHAVRIAAAGFFLSLAVGVGLVSRNRLVEHSQAAYADGLVRNLLQADVAQAPAIIRELEAFPLLVAPRLREENAKGTVTSQQKLHLRLALLRIDSDSTQIRYLYDRLLEAQPHELAVIIDALAPHKQALLDELWAAAAQTPQKARAPQRLRAACALASFTPDDPRWKTIDKKVIAHDLAAVPPVHLERWMDAMRPVRGCLTGPLCEIYCDHSAKREPIEGNVATILADYVTDNVSVLAELLLEADEKQFGVIYAKFQEHGDQGMSFLFAQIDRKLPAHLPASDQERDILAKRQANAAAALLKLNRPEKVWPLLKHSGDPRVRSYLIHYLSPLEVDPALVIQRLNEGPELSIRRALLLCLGADVEKELAPDVRTAMLAKLQTFYRTEPDPGLHSAVEWLLRQWKQEEWLDQVNQELAAEGEREKRIRGIQQLLNKEKGKAPPQWYINSRMQTMVVLPGPSEVQMGSPPEEADREDEDESQHHRVIRRAFAIAATPVTMKQFLEFRPQHKYEQKYAPTLDCPALKVDWYGAAAYCNWLSERDGLPKSEWCYLPNRKDAFESGMKLAPDYLRRTGYRLPTEAEWEFACRAGSFTARFYGETPELLGKYAWYQGNSDHRSWPVGSLKPNDFGLFDMLGEVYTWCQEKYVMRSDGSPIEDVEDDLLVVNNDALRVVRGGSFADTSVEVRAAYRVGTVPNLLNNYMGFRVVRTLR